MKFDLPMISASAKPEFRDTRGCTAWLQTLPLINVGPSHGRLLAELEQLNCCEISPSERLQILELLPGGVGIRLLGLGQRGIGEDTPDQTAGWGRHGLVHGVRRTGKAGMGSCLAQEIRFCHAKFDPASMAA